MQVWCDILKAVPRSRLVLKNKPFLCAETRALWLKRFTSRGVPSWRVDLLPLAAATGDHMSQYGMLDIALDPWPYTGAPPSRRLPLGAFLSGRLFGAFLSGRLFGMFVRDVVCRGC